MAGSSESVEFTTVFDAKSGVIEVTARLVIKNLVEVMEVGGLQGWEGNRVRQLQGWGNSHGNQGLCQWTC